MLFFSFFLCFLFQLYRPSLKNVIFSPFIEPKGLKSSKHFNKKKYIKEIKSLSVIRPVADSPSQQQINTKTLSKASLDSLSSKDIKRIPLNDDSDSLSSADYDSDDSDGKK